MDEEAKTLNPFDGVARAPEGGAAVESERAMQEAKAAVAMAKHYPRDARLAMDRILQACTRPSLAKEASYAYPRGGSMVTGPSIRLAEALAQHWGNIQFGIIELSQSRGESSVMAVAWDLETNTKQFKTFTVKHQRFTRAGVTQLEDPRDIYETIANAGARRMRACILGIIPRDVCEAAEKQCDVTLANDMEAPDKEVMEMLNAFGKFGVTPEMLAKRLGHHLDATIAAEVIMLRKIYASLRDGMSKPEDYFEREDTAKQDAQELLDGQARHNAAKAEKEGQPKLKTSEIVAGLKAAPDLLTVESLEELAEGMKARERNRVLNAAADARIRLED